MEDATSTTGMGTTDVAGATCPEVEGASMQYADACGVNDPQDCWVAELSMMDEPPPGAPSCLVSDPVERLAPPSDCRLSLSRYPTSPPRLVADCAEIELFPDDADVSGSGEAGAIRVTPSQSAPGASNAVKTSSFWEQANQSSELFVEYPCYPIR